MAANLNITDFIRWALLRIDPSELSAAMTQYGYNDDSIESIMDAMQKYPDFVNQFAVMLGEGQAARVNELQRTNQGDDEYTLEDWAQSLGSMKRANSATGIVAEATTDKKNWWEQNGTTVVNSVLGVAGSVLSSIFGNGVAAQNQNSNQQTTSQSGSMTFVYIIVAVVVVAAIALIFVASKKK